MTDHTSPNPPLTFRDRLEGPVILSASFALASILGFYNVGLAYPIPLVALAATVRYAGLRRRNQARREGTPNLLGYVIQIGIFIYLAYGTGLLIADQMY